MSRIVTFSAGSLSGVRKGVARGLFVPPVGGGGFDPETDFGLVGFQSWADIGGIRYGAKADATGPIGGHAGYQNIVTTGDHILAEEDLQTLINQAISGETVFLPGTTVVNLSSGDPITIPAGITLASNRGEDLGSGNFSDGALLFTDTVANRHIIEPAGSGVRLTGLRVQGPIEHHELFLPSSETATHAIRCFTGSNIEIDNCEIYDFTIAGINFRDDNSDGHHVHHNYIHHISRQSAGYGVVMNQCGATIEYNLGDATRHLTAHTGRNPVSNPGSTGSADYTARENVSLSILGTQYDMHSSPEDAGNLGSNNGGRGGVLRMINNYIRDAHNAVSGGTVKLAQIRGTPHALGSEYTHNWIPTSTNWSIDSIFHLIEEQYDCGTQGTCPVWNRNLWDGENKVVRGPGT